MLQYKTITAHSISWQDIDVAKTAEVNGGSDTAKKQAINKALTAGIAAYGATKPDGNAKDPASLQLQQQYRHKNAVDAARDINKSVRGLC